MNTHRTINYISKVLINALTSSRSKCTGNDRNGSPAAVSRSVFPCVFSVYFQSVCPDGCRGRWLLICWLIRFQYRLTNPQCASPIRYSAPKLIFRTGRGIWCLKSWALSPSLHPYSNYKYYCMSHHCKEDRGNLNHHHVINFLWCV